MPAFLIPLYEHGDPDRPGPYPHGKGGGSAARARANEAAEIIAEGRAAGQLPLFHSGDASLDADLQAAIIPQMGSWVEEVLSGATDSDDLIRQIEEDEDNHVAFFSEDPSWVSMKVARKIDKHVTDVTVEDIRKHGQLSIVLVDPDDVDFGQGEEHEGVSRFEVEAEPPFGVERGDIYTRAVQKPDITLTGEALVRFLANYYPDANLVADAQAWRQYTDQLQLPFREHGDPDRPGPYPHGRGGSSGKGARNGGPTTRLYRGDPRAVNVSLSYSDPAALFGAGIYLTTDKRIAGDYTAKGAAAEALFRYSGGPKSTKAQAIEAYIRSKATGLDEHGNRIFYEPLAGYSGDFDSPGLQKLADRDAARIAQATKAWEAEKAGIEVRKLADHTIVFRTKAARAVSSYDIPESWLTKTLDAEAEIPKDVAAAIYNQFRKSSPRLASDLYATAMRADEDGFRPSFRQIYREAAENAAWGAGDLTEESGQLAFRKAMKELGYKGIRYAGGITMGGRRHTAYVFWDEQGLAKRRQKNGASR